MISHEKKIKEVYIPLFSLLIGLLGLLTGIVLQVLDTKSQITLKKYEVTFIEKQKAYAAFFGTMVDCYRDVTDNNRPKLSNDFQALESKLFAMEPFMTQANRVDTNMLLLKFNDLVSKTLNFARDGKVDVASFAQEYEELKNNMHDKLFLVLFENPLGKP